jgi:hypothetical protein
MAIPTTTSTEIDLRTYTAKPGDLITALLIEKIIEKINDLDDSLGTAPVPGPPPVILNVYSQLGTNQMTRSMTVDFSAQTTIVQGINFNSLVVVKLDSILINDFQYQPGPPADTLTINSLPQLTTAGYQVTSSPPDDGNFSVGVLTVINKWGSASRIVMLQGFAQPLQGVRGGQQ